MRKFPGEGQVHYEHRKLYQVVKGAIKNKDVAFFTEGDLEVWCILSTVGTDRKEQIKRLALAEIKAAGKEEGR